MDTDNIPQKFRKERRLETIEMDTSVKPLSALFALLSGKSYNVSRFESEEFGLKLAEIVQHERFDVIHLEGLYLTPYIEIIRLNSNAPIILRAHNIEWKYGRSLHRKGKADSRNGI